MHDPVTGVVSFTVPRSEVKDRFAQKKDLRLDNLDRGMLGLGTVKGVGTRVNFEVFLSKIEEVGGAVVNLT